MIEGLRDAGYGYCKLLEVCLSLGTIALRVPCPRAAWSSFRIPFMLMLMFTRGSMMNPLCSERSILGHFPDTARSRRNCLTV